MKVNGGVGMNARIAALPLPVSEAELPVYRDRTLKLLRQYFNMSLKLGRVPSVLGGEMFRARVSSFRTHTFEDNVIFVHDMERCLEMLEAPEQELIARIALQGHAQPDAARMLAMPLRCVERDFPMAVDKLSGILLRLKLLRIELEPKRRVRVQANTKNAEMAPPKKPAGSIRACQEAEIREMFVSA